MIFAEAVKLVVADVQESYPEVSVEEAIAHVRDTISLDENPPLGATTLVDYEDDLTEAYKVVLSSQETV